METKRVDAGHGWDWVAQAFELYRKNPLIWTSLLAVYMIIAVVVSLVPFVGQIIMTLLAPVFLAGFMIGCRAQAMGDELELAHLFEGFKHNPAQLITVGGFYLLGQFAVILVFLGVMAATIGLPALANMEHMGNNPDPELALQMAESIWLGVLVGLALFIPVLMGMWFSPALIVFDNLGAVEAIKTSFNACIRNFIPFLIYGIVTFVFALVASIPFFLGWLILFPVLTITAFTSYRDIFTPEDEVQSAP